LEYLEKNNLRIGLQLLVNLAEPLQRFVLVQKNRLEHVAPNWIYLTATILVTGKAGCAPWCHPPQAQANEAGGQNCPAPSEATAKTRARFRMARNGPSSALRRLPDAAHRAARRALPSEPFRAIK
jgi:hypothetical protein